MIESGTTALVTGGGRGLGRALCIELANRGFNVLAGARSPSRVEPFKSALDSGGSISVVELDVTGPAPVLPSDLTILVNNAGVRFDFLPIESVPLKDVVSVLETNLTGAIRICQAAIPVMRVGGQGVICNITTCGTHLPMPFHGVYRASKAALSVVTESLRIELASFGIRVIEVPLGPIDTDMLATSPLHVPPAATKLPAYADLARRFMELTPPGAATVTSPSDAAAATVDAILATGGPLRWTVDPGGDAVVSGSGYAAHEGRLEALLAQLATG